MELDEPDEWEEEETTSLSADSHCTNGEETGEAGEEIEERGRAQDEYDAERMDDEREAAIEREPSKLHRDGDDAGDVDSDEQ